MAGVCEVVIVGEDMDGRNGWSGPCAVRRVDVRGAIIVCVCDDDVMWKWVGDHMAQPGASDPWFGPEWWRSPSDCSMTEL